MSKLFRVVLWITCILLVLFGVSFLWTYAPMLWVSHQPMYPVPLNMAFFALMLATAIALVLLPSPSMKQD